MAIPSSIEARLYYRCAFQRYEEAEVLIKATYTTGAVYLAGYGVECILKAMILAAVARNRQRDMLHSFRGGRAHEYEWLRTQYLTNGGTRFPPEITRHFTLVNDWSTDLRYTPALSASTRRKSFWHLQWPSSSGLTGDSEMAIQIPRGKSDAVIDEIVKALSAYEADHPQAQIDLYRQNAVSVRVRIIDPDFAGQGKSHRSQQFWQYLKPLSEDVQGDISTVLLLTPDETTKSFANFEFDDPIPSKL